MRWIDLHRSQNPRMSMSPKTIPTALIPIAIRQIASRASPEADPISVRAYQLRVAPAGAPDRRDFDDITPSE